MSTYRNELKYTIKPFEHLILSKRLSKVLDVDEHGIDGCYHIRSLYFDNDYDHSLHENLLGLSHRTKYRLRMYDFDQSFLVFEQKSKRIDKGLKMHLILSVDEAQALIQGQYDFLKHRKEAWAQVFYLDLHRNKLKPKLIIDYKREAYQFKPGNVRITLDTHIQTSTQVLDFFNSNLALCPERCGQVLLEVKFDAYLPDLIQSLFSPIEAQRTAHSKYVIGRLAHR